MKLPAGEWLDKLDDERKDAVIAHYAKGELYKLLKRVAKTAKIGRKYIEDDAIGLDIGGGELYSSIKYEVVSFSPIESRPEYDFDELEINDRAIIINLMEEIEKRYMEFQESRIKKKVEYLKAKKMFANIIFGRSIKQILKQEGADE